MSRVARLLKFCGKFDKIMVTWWNLKKNFYGMFGKILFTKCSSKIVLKVSKSLICRKKLNEMLKIFWEGIGVIFKKVWDIFLEFCGKFTKMWRFLKKYL